MGYSYANPRRSSQLFPLNSRNRTLYLVLPCAGFPGEFRDSFSEERFQPPQRDHTSGECEIVLEWERECRSWKIFPMVVGKKRPSAEHQETRGGEPGGHQHETQNGKRTKLGKPAPREMDLHSERWKEEGRSSHGCLVPRGWNQSLKVGG